MTVYVPLSPTDPPSLPATPSFLVPSSDPAEHLSSAIRAILKARRIVVICGAGISVQAGIPDFRSADGLFQSIKRDNPKEAMSSGKELFDVSVFNSEQKTSLFCQMIAQLSDLSQAAEPTSFHRVLRALDDSGKLLRVYTQNIDAIEQKSGLSFGVPGYGYEGRRSSKSRTKKSSSAVMGEDTQQDDSNQNNGHLNLNDTENDTTTHTNVITNTSGGGPSFSAEPEAGPSSTSASASTSRLPSPPAETPRCIPLHGTLQSMHCQICNHSFPLLPYLPHLTSGVPPPCPECTSLEATRQLVGKRPRGIGRLRPSVVLYNEMHKDGEGVGEVVERDLVGGSSKGNKGKGRSGADLLLVVGTSLRVPGTKRMVREFAKAVKARGGNGKEKEKEKEEQSNAKSGGNGLATPAPSPRRSPAADDEPPLLSSSSTTTTKGIKAVYLNLDFPVPTREWEGVFDAWIQGDAQEFAEVLNREIGKEMERKEEREERKRGREKKREERERIEGKRMERRLEKRKEKEKVNNGSGSVTTKTKTSTSTPTSTKRKHGPSSSSSLTMRTTDPPATTTATPSSSDNINKRRKRPTVAVVLPISPPHTPLVRSGGSALGTASVFGRGFSGLGGGSGALGGGGGDEEEDDEDEDECEKSQTPTPMPTPKYSRTGSKAKGDATGKGKRRERERENDVNPFLDLDLDLETGFSSLSSLLVSSQEKERKKTGMYLTAAPYKMMASPSSSSYTRMSLGKGYEPDSTMQHQSHHQHHHPYYGYEYDYGRPVYQTPSKHQVTRYMDMDQGDDDDVDVDMDTEVDVVGDGDGDGDGDVEMELELEVGRNEDVVNDWRYYDNVRYAPSLRYGQIHRGERRSGAVDLNRRSASPPRPRPLHSHSRSYGSYSTNSSHTHLHGQGQVGAERSYSYVHAQKKSTSGGFLVSASSSSSSSGSGSASSSGSSSPALRGYTHAHSHAHGQAPVQAQTHVPAHLSRHAHVLAPPSPSHSSPPSPPLSQSSLGMSASSPTSPTSTHHRHRSNDYHRLGGRIEHSRTHLASHMARTLRSSSGAMDSD